MSGYDRGRRDDYDRDDYDRDRSSHKDRDCGGYDESSKDRILYCENEWCTFSIHLKVCVFRISHDKGRSRQKKWLPKRQGRSICYR